MTDTEKDISKIVKDAVVPSTEPSSKQVTPAQTDNKVISTEMSDVGKAAETETKYSPIAYDKNNVPYVIVDEDILKNVPKKKWNEVVKNNLKKKFPNGIKVGNQTIYLNSKSRRELTHSKDTKYLKNNDLAVLKDKYRATNNADEILQASRDYVGEKPKHVRTDNINEFANGKIQMRIGNNDYIAEVIIGTTKSNNLILYDIVRLNPSTIQTKLSKMKGARTVQLLQEQETVENVPPFNNKVPQNNGFVNNQFMQNNENVASDNGNVEKSTKPLTIEQRIRAFLNSENERVSTATGKTLTEDAFAVVEPTTRKQKNLVKDCASLGIEVRYIKTQNNDIIGTSHNINGAYRDGVIYINEDAQNPYRVVLGHEVTHQIKVTDINAYNALEDIARKHIGESFDNLTLDKQEEAVADFVGAVMDNPRAYKSVFQQNRNLLQRFIEAVDSIIGKFRGTETYNDDLGRMLNDTRAELTGEGAGETKHSFVDDANSSDTIDLSDDNDLSMRIKNQSGSKKYNIIRDYILETLSEQPIILSDGIVAKVDKSDALHLANKSANKKTAYISKIKTIIEKAKFCGEDTNTVHNKFDAFRYYEAKVKFGKETYPVYLNVGHAKNGDGYHIYDITRKIGAIAKQNNALERVENDLRSEIDSPISGTILPQTTGSVKEENSDTTKHSRMTGTGDTSAASEQQSNVIDSNPLNNLQKGDIIKENNIEGNDNYGINRSRSGDELLKQHSETKTPTSAETVQKGSSGGIDNRGHLQRGNKRNIEARTIETVVKLAPGVIGEKRKIYKGVSANVDFYSGLIYKMLELPYELYTPIFAISRISGWSAHRIEEIQNNGKIIRPAYINVKETKQYVNLSER